MTELIIIKTNEGQKIKAWLKKEHIAYENYREEAETSKKKITEKELEKAYQEAYQDPARLKLAKEWEKTALTDLNKREKNEWKNI